MWIASVSGWFSVVKHRELADTFMVRGRVKGDLENLRSLAGIEQEVVATPHADYPFRLIVSGAQVQDVLARLGEGISYPNFKGKIGKLPGQRAKLGAYHEVWASMSRTEEPGAREAEREALALSAKQAKEQENNDAPRPAKS